MTINAGSSNNALVTKLTNVRKHPNADRLQLADVAGTTVIVGLDAVENDEVIYFDANLALSPEYLKANNLYQKPEKNSDRSVKGGFFGNNGRVKAIRLRGSISNGYVASIKSLMKVTEDDIPVLKQGTEFNKINGVQICFKYVAPVKGLAHNESSKTSGMFIKHWDTKHFARSLKKIPEGIIYVEEKIHGTSARIGRVRVPAKTGFLGWLSEKVLRVKRVANPWEVLHGSRNIVLGDGTVDDYYKGTVRDVLKAKHGPSLKKGEQIYFEIAGYDTNGSAIQKLFSYGCLQKEHVAVLYRITQANEDGEIFEMSREYVYKRAKELGMDVAPIFAKHYYDGTEEGLNALVELVKGHTDGRSAIDAGTMREGVVVWFEGCNGQYTCLKNKSFDFIELESQMKDQPDFVDVEDES